MFALNSRGHEKRERLPERRHSLPWFELLFGRNIKTNSTHLNTQSEPNLPARLLKAHFIAF